MRQSLIAVALVLVSAGVAAAYPQFQLARDQTCTGCHISPAGGSLLNENGYNDRRGDLAVRDLTGVPLRRVEAAELADARRRLPRRDRLLPGAATRPRRVPDAGRRLRERERSARSGARHRRLPPAAVIPATARRRSGPLWSREHYLEWQSKPGENEGVYVRVGRFMPVFGLRFVEHVDYTRQYGGMPLYGETYGASVSYVTSKYEAHLSGYIEDPLIDAVVHDNGGTFYGETRLDEHTAVGVEAMVADNDRPRTYRGGVTGKKYLAGPDLLFQLEVQAVTERVKNDQDRGAPTQLVGYLMASKFIGQAILIDLGLGHFDENVRIQGLDRDAIDLNVHWFATSHVELLLQNRISKVGLGASPSGVTGGWSMLQVHYRL